MKTIIIILIAILTCTLSFAQINKEEKTPQQEERGKALKQWFDSGDIIIDCYIEDQTWISTEKNDGYLCDKVKINRILKGKLNAGYINLKTAGQKAQPPMDINYPDGYDVVLHNHLLMRIVKTEYAKEGFNTENNGVYEPDPYGHRFVLNYLPISLHVNKGDKDYSFSNINDLYKNIQEYCGIDLGLPKTTPEEKPIEKKSLKSTEITNNVNNEVVNNIAWQQKLKNRSEYLKTHSQKTNHAPCKELFISEYLEGTTHNTALEFYNPSENPIILNRYFVRVFMNGAPTPLITQLNGTLAPKHTYVIANPNASLAILAIANQTSHKINFNGDDAIQLIKVLNNVNINIDSIEGHGGNPHDILDTLQLDTLDQIGITEVYPGNNGWAVTPNGSTKDTDLRRKYSISGGDTSWTNCKNEWDIFPEDSIYNFGQHQNICITIPDPDLTLELVNPQTTGTSPKYLEFDIYVSSSIPTYLEDCGLYFNYNTAAFGSNIATSNLIVTNGSAFNLPNYQAPSINNSTSSKFSASVNVNYSNTSWNLVQITSTPQKLMHIKMKIANCNIPANVQITDLNTTINITDYYTSSYTTSSNPWYLYDNILLGTSQFNNNTCGPIISSFYPASVIAGAYYTGIPYNESKLTINGSDFGNNKGTILMKNAKNNSAPLYIPIDDYDIPVWTNNLIEVNVPSIIFLNNSQSGLYPGSGYFYVKPEASTDSVKSPSMLQIPYILKDFSVNGSTAKLRLPFAYRNVIDSSGTADSAAYWFRFDIATVANNPNPHCRQLLKQAIQDWACELDIRYRIGTDTTITTTTSDGFSYITFKNVLSNPAFIAETYISPNQCNGNIYSLEADISFLLNPFASGYPNWYYVRPDSTYLGNTILNTTDFFGAALHELGHASLLLHVNDSTDLMYFKIFQNVPRNSMGSISFNDQSGGVDDVGFSKTFTYPASGCPFNPFKIPDIVSGACVSPDQGVQSIGSNAFQLSVYPNPASQVLNITFIKEKASSNTVKLTTITGQTIFYKNIGKNEGANETINVTELAKGLYILVVTDNANTVYNKILIE